MPGKLRKETLPRRVREKIESGIERLLGSKEQVAPYVGSLYALSYPEIEDVSPEFWRSRLFEGVQAIIGALTQHGPTIFCFEDIHWADPSTLDLLRYLISELRHPALVSLRIQAPFQSLLPRMHSRPWEVGTRKSAPGSFAIGHAGNGGVSVEQRYHSR